MGTRVITLLPNGTFTVETGEYLEDLPMVQTGRKDNQRRHTLEEDPVYTLTPVVPVSSFRELSEIPSPRQLPLGNGTRQEMIVPDNSLYPVTPNPDPDPVARQLGRENILAIANQNAKNKAAKANYDNGITNIWAIALAGVVVVMTAIFAIIALSVTLSKDEVPINQPSAVHSHIDLEGDYGSNS